MPSAAALKAGRAVIELGLDSAKVRVGLDKLEDRLRRFGKTLQRVGRQMTFLGGAITAAFVPAIKAASDFEETLSKFNVVFGDRSDEVREWGQLFGKTVGRSEKQVLQFLASFQDLFVPIGFEPGAAEEMSKQVTQLAFDLASFNNFADADVVRDLQAAITGSGETMKKYGTIVNVAAVNQELLNMGLDPTTATNAEKAMARLNIVFQQTTAAQGDVIRTSDSVANLTKRVRAEIDNAAVAIGGALLPVVQRMLQVVTPVITRLGEWIKQNQALVIALAVAGASLLTFGLTSLAVGKILIGLRQAILAVRIALIALVKNPWIAVITLGLAAVLELTGALDYLVKKLDSLADVDVGKDLTDKFKNLRKEAEKLTNAASAPTLPQLAVAGLSPRGVGGLFDTRLALQVFGQQGSRVENEQLRVLKKIEENTASGATGIPVI